MSGPNNADEWWGLVDKNWNELFAIMGTFCPMNVYENHSGSFIDIQMEDEINRCYKDRDPELARYFQLAWWNAPDSRSIHSIPGWGILCDLCSEEWCIHSEEEQEEVNSYWKPYDE